MKKVYTAPEAKVIEAELTSMICVSFEEGTTGTMHAPEFDGFIIDDDVEG